MIHHHHRQLPGLNHHQLSFALFHSLLFDLPASTNYTPQAIYQPAARKNGF